MYRVCENELAGLQIGGNELASLIPVAPARGSVNFEYDKL